MTPASKQNTPVSAVSVVGNKATAREPRVGLRGGRYRQHTLAEKFAARVIVGEPDACWPMQGSAVHSGHVYLTMGSPWKPPFIRVRAHVYAWEQAHGRRVPTGMVVMHACDNPRCCNPRHLSVGTQRDNVLDSVRKGRYNCFGIQKLNAAKVQEIRALAASGRLQKAIAAQFGIARNTVSAIVNGKTWAHLPFAASGNPVFERVPHVELPVLGEVS